MSSWYSPKCDNFFVKSPGWCLYIQFNPMCSGAHERGFGLTHRPKVCGCWDTASLFQLWKLRHQYTRSLEYKKPTWILVLRSWRNSMKELWIKFDTSSEVGRSNLVEFGCMVTRQFRNITLPGNNRLYTIHQVTLKQPIGSTVTASPGHHIWQTQQPPSRCFLLRTLVSLEPL